MMGIPHQLYHQGQRGLGGDMNLVFNVVFPEGAFGTMFGNEVTPTGENL